MTLLRGAGLDERGGWVVPEDYNVVSDVVDWHPRQDLAMIWAHADGRQRRVSWGELKDGSCRVARMLLDHGVEPRDVVGVVMPQTVEAAMACIGVLRAGAVLLCMSPLWSDAELLNRLRRASSTLALADPGQSARLRAVAGQAVKVATVTSQQLREYAAGHLLVELGPEAPAHMYFTSGTTGPAKALVHAQRNLIGHNEFELCHALRPGDVFYGAGEWAWSQAKLLGPWRHDAVQFVFSSPRLDPNALFAAMSRAGVTSALLNPSLLKAVKAKLSKDVAALPWSLRTVCSSNETLSADLNLWFENTFGCSIREYYGLTESYPMLGYQADEPIRQASTGRPLPGWDVELANRDGAPIHGEGFGEARLAARSNPQYPLGYLTEEGIDSTAFDGEWFSTGDTFQRDGDGYWYFVGRNDDVIKTSGYRVGPYELERLLERHPAVSEAAVVGAPDPDRGQLVHAFVVRSRAGRTVAPEALTGRLQQFAKERHSAFAYPRRITFLEELPKSFTGKIQRALLRQRVEGHG